MGWSGWPSHVPLRASLTAPWPTTRETLEAAGLATLSRISNVPSRRTTFCALSAPLIGRAYAGSGATGSDDMSASGYTWKWA